MIWEGWCANQASGRPGKARCKQECEFCRNRRQRDNEPEVVVPHAYHSELSTGGFIDLERPDPAVIHFDAISRGLSQLCRYNGQCSTFYSVAEHACLVAHRLESLGCSPAACMAGLHHDDAEALCVDVPRPLKKLLGSIYDEIEERVFEAVTEALGISQLPFHDPAVKEADDWTLTREAYELMPSKGEFWHVAEKHPPGPAPWRLGADPTTARRMFVSWHVRLKRQVFPC